MYALHEEMQNAIPDRASPLLTDLYQLAMGQARTGVPGAMDQEGSFQLYFRRAPFGGRFAVAAGIEGAIQDLARARFSDEDLAWLEQGQGPLPAPFASGFLEALRTFPRDLRIDAVADGTVVLPGVPLVRVEGPLWQAQLAETFLLNRIGFETLIATKAEALTHAAGEAKVLEFGARRAQGPDAAVRAARAAWIGGVAGTSNVLAARLHGIPVRGTHSHAWVQSFATSRIDTASSELAAFRAFAEAYPDASVLLVDTYDTMRGVENAILVARELRERGSELVGIRLDSGDLEALSRAARGALDQAGFPDVQIVASDALDTEAVAALRSARAPIDTFGVGTALVTGGAQSSLGVVFKLGAVRAPGEARWSPVMKLSAEPAKRSLPGRVVVHRTEDPEDGIVDVVGLEGEGRSGAPLLRRAMEDGEVRADFGEGLAAARERAGAQAPVARRGVRVELSEELAALSGRLTAEALP